MLVSMCVIIREAPNSTCRWIHVPSKCARIAFRRHTRREGLERDGSAVTCARVFDDPNRDRTSRGTRETTAVASIHMAPGLTRLDRAERTVKFVFAWPLSSGHVEKGACSTIA